MEYKCSMCGGTFTAEWSEEEAIAEKERDFGSVALKDCDVVCDVCYQEISPRNNPEYYGAYRKAEKVTGFKTPLPSLTALDDAEAVRAYVDAEICRRLSEALDRWEIEQLTGH